MVETVKTQYQVTWVNSLTNIPQADWDALALPLKTPFLEWEWLTNLETSGSATAQTGWLPNHLTVWQGQTLVAAAPLYLKSHSYGEFVFDQEWADVAHRVGLNYYPKLLGMTPFTPAEGYRFLIATGEDEDLLTDIMLQEIDRFCDRTKFPAVISYLSIRNGAPNWSLADIRVGCIIAIFGKITSLKISIPI